MPHFSPHRVSYGSAQEREIAALDRKIARAIEELGGRTTQGNWPTGAEIQSHEFWLYSPNFRRQLVL